MSSFSKVITFCFIFSLASTALANDRAVSKIVEISGVDVNKTIEVPSANNSTTLKLNGAGFRNKIFFYRVYVAALYLTDTSNKTIAVLRMEGPKQMDLTMLKPLTSATIQHGIKDGVAKNSNEEELERLSNQLSEFDELFTSIPDMKKGDRLSLQWIPDVGTNVLVNGKKVGEPIDGVDFYNALLRMWIGANPVDRSLKVQLLGGVQKP